MRHLIAFPCNGETLIGSLDEAAGATGLLIVSGGNEVRAGAHRGMAMLAGAVAAAGFPAFRYDRRGVGDSSGENRGYAASGPDLAAAAATFRAATGVRRIVGFGNCDAASALALFGRTARVDVLVVTNPWIVEPVDDLPPAAAIRARYAARLRDPAALRRLVTGGVSLRKLARGIGRAAVRPSGSPPLLAAIADWGDDATIILATGDATALAYADAAASLPSSPPILRLPTASHSFADVADALTAAVIRTLQAIQATAA